jgi:hypothetical protein
MADFSVKIEIVANRMKKCVSSNGLRVYVFRPDTNAACEEGIFLIHSLYIQSIFNCQQNSENDSSLHLVCTSLYLSFLVQQILS